MPRWHDQMTPDPHAVLLLQPPETGPTDYPAALGRNQASGDGDKDKEPGPATSRLSAPTSNR